jgi:hypothetical protein
MWQNFTPATCFELVNKCFCELDHVSAIIRQPINSFSSLFFLLLLIPILRSSAKNKIFFSTILIVLSVGSFLLHSTLTLFGQFVDVLGMYLVTSFILLKSLQIQTNFWHKYLATNIVLGLLLFTLPQIRRELFIVLVVLTIVQSYRSKILFNKNFTLAILSLSIGGIFWYLDQNRIICSPNGFWQLHSVWHICSAFSIYFIFKVFDKN